MTIRLPVHPVTGLRALGFTKRGPIWPVIGGAPDDSEKDGGTGAPTLTYSQARNRADEVNARMEQINELDKPTDEEDAEFRALGEEFDSLYAHMGRLERAAEMARVASAHSHIGKPAASRMRIERGSIGGATGRDDYDRDAILEPDSVEDCRFRNPWDLSEVRSFGRSPEEVGTELRARALSAVEKMPGATDNIRQAAATIIERYDDKNSSLAKMCLASSSPAYLRAFAKLARNHGHMLTSEEQRAVTSVRAMSLTDSAGGYLVPFQLDPTVINTSAGSRNDIRQVARQVVATGDVWNGVSSANVSWSWDAEGTEVSDDSPTFGQPSITVHKAAGFVPITIEALEDEANVTATVGDLLAGGKDDLEAVALITGSGTGQPVGIVTALTGTASEINAVADDTFNLAEVYRIQGALPARYRANSSWLANNLIYNLIRQFDTSGGGGFWTNLNDGRPPQLLGRPAVEAESMDGTVTTSGAVSNFILIYGDFSNYVIVDRIGMTVEFIPHLFHTANNRPSGSRGWYAHTRMGADSVSDNAFRMLDVASVA